MQPRCELGHPGCKWGVHAAPRSGVSPASEPVVRSGVSAYQAARPSAVPLPLWKMDMFSMSTQRSGDLKRPLFTQKVCATFRAREVQVDSANMAHIFRNCCAWNLVRKTSESLLSQALCSEAQGWASRQGYFLCEVLGVALALIFLLIIA